MELQQQHFSTDHSQPNTKNVRLRQLLAPFFLDPLSFSAVTAIDPQSIYEYVYLSLVSSLAPAYEVVISLISLPVA